MEMVKIDAADYGLEKKKAAQISDMFKPMLDQMVALEEDYNEVVKLETSIDKSRAAKELRLKYVKIRTGTAAIHKDLKQFYLQGGRFVDGWKNAQLMASQGVEDELQGIENHFANIEKEKIAKIQQARQDELAKYTDEDALVPDNLGAMEDDVWDNYIKGAENNHKAKIAAEKAAEEERLAKEKAEQEERERVEKENAALRKEMEEVEKKRLAEVAEREKVEIDRMAKEKADAKLREEKEKQEREAREKKELEERAAHQVQLDKEREEREKLEAELKVKQDAEAKAVKDEQDRVQSELNKGDEDKVNDLVNDLNALKGKYEFKSEKNQGRYKGVGELIDKVVDYIEKEN